VGAIEAPNRILMAPMTRARGTGNHVHTLRMIKTQSGSAVMTLYSDVGLAQASPRFSAAATVPVWRLV